MAEPCFTTLELEESAGQAKDSEYVTMVKRVAAISYAGEFSSIPFVLCFNRSLTPAGSDTVSQTLNGT